MTTAHIPRSHQRDVVGCAGGRAYRLRIALPQGDPPSAGWPALIVLDGDAYFGFTTDATRNRGDLAREIEPCVVVAIGYPDERPDAWHGHRVLDYTPAGCASASLRGAQGGLEDFLAVVETQVIPLMAAAFQVDAGRCALWGHSLGGLAAVWALLTRPAMCRSYLAVSPALWVAQEAIARRLDDVARGALHGRRAHVAVGALEETPPAAAAPAVAGQVRAARMIGNARELADRLAGVDGLAVRYQELAGEGHVTVAYAALREGLDLAFPPLQGDRHD